jgi:hypothetical protein
VLRNKFNKNKCKLSNSETIVWKEILKIYINGKIPYIQELEDNIAKVVILPNLI